MVDESEPNPDDRSESRLICPVCSKEIRSLPHHCTEELKSLVIAPPAGPYEVLQAEMDCYRRASQRPDNLITVIGMWMIWGTISLVALCFLVAALVAVPFLSFPEHIAACLVGCTFSGFFLWVGVHFLRRTTSNYLKMRASEAETSPSDDENDAHESAI